MRAISLVDRLEFNFEGNVCRKAVTLGDVDNDGNNELIVGNDEGEVVVFKDGKKWLTLSGLNFITCIAVGDILNINKNCLVIVTGDGWCYIYCCVTQMVCLTDSSETQIEESGDQVDGQMFSTESIESEKSFSTDSCANSSVDKEKTVLKRILVQRIPADSKDILLGDIDGDGAIEMVIGLTDRIIRSYRWCNDPIEIHPSESQQNVSNVSQDVFENISGKLIGLNKWECAKQIGSVSLHYTKDGFPALLVAQPGGTFMRILCRQEDTKSHSSDSGEGHSDSGSSQSEGLMNSKVDYQFLGLSRMRNQNISTEIIGNIRTKFSNNKTDVISDVESVASSSSGQSNKSVHNLQKQVHLKPDGIPYAVSTLDGTIMLVQNEVILWAIAVDHQIFALHKLDVTGNGVDDIIACCWDGQTYILDQNKNSVRYHLNEAVQTFDCGFYNVTKNSPQVTCFVYVTFRNKIYLYYDIPLKNIVCKRFEPDLSHVKEILEDSGLENDKLNKNKQRELVNFLLYNN